MHSIKVSGNLEDIFKREKIDLQVEKTLENIKKFREKFMKNKIGLLLCHSHIKLRLKLRLN